MTKKSFTWTLAAMATMLLATPAHAQENLLSLDYIEMSNAKSLEPGASQAQYQLDTGAETTSSLSNQLALAYGLTNTLTVAGSLQTGGLNGDPLGSPSYQVGMLYVPALATRGWTPGLQLQYQGGFDQALVARGIFSFDTPVVAIGNGAVDRFNLSTNISAEQSFQRDSAVTFGYNLGVSYPLLGSPMTEKPEAKTNLQQLQRRPDSKLRAGLELKGDLSADGSHYAIPQLMVSPSDAVQVGLGVGLRLAGQDKPLFVQTQLQLNF